MLELLRYFRICKKRFLHPFVINTVYFSKLPSGDGTVYSLAVKILAVGVDSREMPV